MESPSFSLGTHSEKDPNVFHIEEEDLSLEQMKSSIEGLMKETRGQLMTLPGGRGQLCVVRDAEGNKLQWNEGSSMYSIYDSNGRLLAESDGGAVWNMTNSKESLVFDKALSPQAEFGEAVPTFKKEIGEE